MHPNHHQARVDQIIVQRPETPQPETAGNENGPESPSPKAVVRSGMVEQSGSVAKMSGSPTSPTFVRPTSRHATGELCMLPALGIAQEECDSNVG
jgi:hypothetical protein